MTQTQECVPATPGSRLPSGGAPLTGFDKLLWEAPEPWLRSERWHTGTSKPFTLTWC